MGSSSSGTNTLRILGRVRLPGGAGGAERARCPGGRRAGQRQSPARGRGSPARSWFCGEERDGEERPGCPELLTAAFVRWSERGGHGTAVSRANTGEAKRKL